jgi:tetratricopeptide (TPR) repeat protein
MGSQHDDAFMNARVTNPAVRWLVFAVVGLISGVLGLLATRHSIAAHWANSSNPDRWLRAAEIEPSNAENWYRLGRYRQLDFEHADLPLAISYYQRAVAIDPGSASYWMDLAEAYEMAGSLGQAEQAFRTAQRVYPISGEVAWRFGNFLLRRDRVDEAFQQIHHALSVDAKLTTLAVSLCWRSTRDIDRILKVVLPDEPDAYWGAIDSFVNSHDPDAAAAVWKRMAMDRPSFPLPRAFRLLDMLIESGHVDDARSVWQQALSAARITPEAGPAGSLIWNGGFEGELLNGGFAWRYRPAQGFNIDFDEGSVHSGRRSLRLVFDGAANVDFEHVWQYVAVEPSTRYRFNAYFQTQELTTDSGIRFEIHDVTQPRNPPRSTPNITGTQPWSLDDIEFTTAPETRLLRIVLRRAPSNKFDNKIRGTAWVDDVSIVPISARNPAGR